MKSHATRVIASVILLNCSRDERPLPSFRKLASDVSLNECAVDRDFVFGVDGTSIARISRRTGAVDKLPNAHTATDLVAANGTVYWIDSDGVHAWRVGTTVRTEIQKFDHPYYGQSLVRFGERLCWGYNRFVPQDDPAAEDYLRIDCTPLAGGDIERWGVLRTFSTPTLVVGFGRMYAAVDRTYGCELVDATTHVDEAERSAPRLGLVDGYCVGELAMTREEPLLLRSLEAGRRLNLMRSNRELGLPERAAHVVVIGSRTLTATPEGPAEIDLASGQSRLLERVQLSELYPHLCADESTNTLFLEGPKRTIFEVPLNRNPRG